MGSTDDFPLTVWLSSNLHALGMFHATLSDAVSHCASAAVGFLDKFITLSTKWDSRALMCFLLIDNGRKIFQKVKSTLIFLVQTKTNLQITILLKVFAYAIIIILRLNYNQIPTLVSWKIFFSMIEDRYSKNTFKL